MELALIVECWEAMGAVRDADVSAEATAYVPRSQGQKNLMPFIQHGIKFIRPFEPYSSGIQRLILMEPT